VAGWPGRRYSQAPDGLRDVVISHGAGGTANIGLARVTYAIHPAFARAADDLVEIDPGDGEGATRRARLDTPASH
jgi:hypothetical protein